MEPQVSQLIRDVRAKVVADPESPDAWHGFAAACDAHNLNDCAEFGYRRGWELSPKDFRFPYLLAQALYGRGQDTEEVLALLEEAAELAPSYAPIHFEKGEVLAREGELREAQDSYRNAIAIDQGFSAAHRGLGQVLLALDDLPAAMTHLEEAARLSPQDRAAFSALAQGYTRIGDTTRASTAADRARTLSMANADDPVRDHVRSMGSSSAIQFERAKKLFMEGRLIEATELLRTLEPVAQDNQDLQILLATVLARRGRLDEAITRFERAAELGLPVPALHVNWGNALLLKGERRQAEQHYRDALGLDSAFADAHFQLGILMERTGRVAEAIEHFRLVIETSPQHLAAQRLAKLEAAGP